MGGREGISKKNEEVFRGDGYVCYFDCGDGFRGTDMLKLTKFYKFGMRSLLYISINYASINLLSRNKQLKGYLQYPKKVVEMGKHGCKNTKVSNSQDSGVRARKGRSQA